MFKRLRVSSTIRIRNLLIRLLPSSRPNHARFIILCHPRTGSTLLHTYLNSHWNVVSYGNLIGMNFSERVLGKGHSVDDFFASNVEQPYPAFIKAAGFKFFYQYTDCNWARTMLKYLHNKNYKIVHLRRKDGMRTALSYLLAKKTSAWSRGLPHDPVTLDPDEVINAMKKLQEREAHYSELAGRFETLEIFYEDLTHNPEKILDDVQSFLGLPKRRLITVLKRQHGDSLDDEIVNYAELKYAIDQAEAR